MTLSHARSRMVWLAVLPLVGAIAAIGALVHVQMRGLEREQELL